MRVLEHEFSAHEEPLAAPDSVCWSSEANFFEPLETGAERGREREVPAVPVGLPSESLRVFPMVGTQSGSLVPMVGTQTARSFPTMGTVDSPPWVRICVQLSHLVLLRGSGLSSGLPSR